MYKYANIPLAPKSDVSQVFKVDLSNGRTSTMDTMSYADRFLGGRGIATRIYWEEVLPGTGAFDPENRLIFMTGPLVATGTQGAARCMVIGKSPMLKPEGFCYGNIGSFFGPYLKIAGYDGLIIHGRSSKPVFLLIHDKNVQIHDASSLWGKGVYAAGNILKNEYGKRVRFITTGVAGENLSRSANLMTENDGSVTGGFGAVFGSKNLKAIAVMGSGGPATAQPDRLNLQRAILLREGLQPEKDDFPAEFNFTNPVKEIYLNPDVIVPGRGEKVISRKGQTLDRKTYDRMLKEFYKIRGWDPESGLQRADILCSQRLSDLAHDLNKIDLLEQ